jgi:homoserine acetyltransferase
MAGGRVPSFESEEVFHYHYCSLRQWPVDLSLKFRYQAFPRAITFFDNVRAQHKLVTEKLGVKHARAVVGWSMGAGQTYQWATSYPDFMDLCAPLCGSAKVTLESTILPFESKF